MQHETKSRLRAQQVATEAREDEARRVEARAREREAEAAREVAASQARAREIEQRAYDHARKIEADAALRVQQQQQSFSTMSLPPTPASVTGSVAGSTYSGMFPAGLTPTHSVHDVSLAPPMGQ